MNFNTSINIMNCIFIYYRVLLINIDYQVYTFPSVAWNDFRSNKCKFENLLLNNNISVKPHKSCDECSCTAISMQIYIRYWFKLLWTILWYTSIAEFFLQLHIDIKYIESYSFVRFMFYLVLSFTLLHNFEFLH